MQRRKPNAPAVRCKDCGAPTSEPRKGLCSRCYQADYHGREVAQRCACCGDGRRRVLVRKRLGEDMVTLCGNCAAVAGRRPLTLEELVAEVFPAGDRRGPGRRQGERRAPSERRTAPDLGALEERRQVERRAS